MTKVSTSFGVDADTYVRPLMAVSTRVLTVSCAPFAPIVTCAVCRITKVKLNVSSSSLLSLIIKLGMPPAEGSGSCNCQRDLRLIQRRSYLDIFHSGVVFWIPGRRHSSSREGIWCNVQYSSSSRSDRERGDGY